MKQCIWCKKEITEKKRKVYCSKTCYEAARRKGTAAIENIKPDVILKKKEVCKGCRYLFKGQSELRNTCNYIEMTGNSRMLIEIANGGIKSDSCCCYEEKGRSRV